MKQSALWFPFFFVGLLLACARFADGKVSPASSSGDPTQAAVLAHHVKVAIEGSDRLGAREPAFAETRNVAPQRGR